MASISTAANGRRTIQFNLGDKKRRSIRLGLMPMKHAETFKLRVELIVGAKLAGHAVDDETSRWLAKLDQSLHDKLADVGLVPRRLSMLLKPFLDAYIAGRKDIKPATFLHISQSANKLVECYGFDRQLGSITAYDAEKFRLKLLADGMGENTVRRHCGRAKQFFTAAMKRDLVAKNPFSGIVSNVRGNPSRFYYLTVDDAAKILDGCPDLEWRLIFALSRFGGLRCPSEHLALRWGDIDWAKNRMRVRSPKTEHHEGRESRLVPLFPELRPILEAAFDQATPGTEFVINRYRSATVNLRTRFEQIIRGAGLTPWPKLFQNLRSTRQTELSIQGYATHVVCAWIGNTEAVANKHYFQVPDSEFDRAAGAKALDSKPASEALQNPVQQAAVSGGMGKQAQEEGHVFAEKYVALPLSAVYQAPRLGLEPRT